MVTTIDFDNSFQRKIDEIRDITEQNVLMLESLAQLLAVKIFLQDRFSFSGHYVGILLYHLEQRVGRYSAFNTCSLICSSSSFIFTTMFCISA